MVHWKQTSPFDTVRGERKIQINQKRGKISDDKRKLQSISSMILSQKVLVKSSGDIKFGCSAARRKMESPKGKLDVEKEHNRNVMK